MNTTVIREKKMTSRREDMLFGQGLSICTIPSAIFTVIFLVIVSLGFPLSAQPFVHPGALHTQADFDRMKAKVAAGAHPWIDDWNILINTGVSSNYTPTPMPILQRGNGGGACFPSDNYQYAYWDTEAAYQLALRWKITGDNNYANAVTNILNQWAIVCTNLCGDPNITLLELYGCQFACVGDIMRSYTNWTSSDVTNFQAWMVNLWEPMNNAFLSAHDGTCSTYMWANWDLCCMASMMSIGILCDDTNIYNEALNYFKSGIGNGNIEQTVYNMFPGYLGQGQEEGRDQGHSGLEVALLGEICTMSYNQGTDLFAYENNRVLSLCEYFAKYNLGNTVPYLPYDNCDGVYQSNISNNSQGDSRPCWDLIYNHYVNLKGIAAPWSAQYAANLRPDGSGGNGDELGFTTLTCSLTPIVVGANPSGLTAKLNGPQQVQLNWWGTANATNYFVKRATTSGGPYTTIATITTNLLTYTDSNVTNGVTYYYTVSALTPLGESGNAVEANLTVQPQLVAYYKFNEISGTNAADATGNGWTGTLMNGATWTTGHSNNCVNLSSSSQQYVSLPNNITTNLNDFTIAAWVNLTSITTWMRIFDFGWETNAVWGSTYYTTPTRYMLLTPQGSSGVVRFTITTGGGGTEQVMNGTSALPVGSWHHVAVTLAGTNGTLYVDGAPVGSSAITITPSQLGSTSQNCIGKSQYSGDPYLNGKVDDFRIYNGALSAAQIAALAAGYPVQPPAPTNVVATAVSANQINLTWSPDAGATNYYVRRSMVGGGPYTTISVPLTATNFSDIGLVGGTTYYYVIAAANDGGTTNSAEVNATTLTAPSAPASLTAVPGTTGAIVLSWPASSGATSYNILRANFSGGPYAVVATGITSTGYTNTGMYGSVTYYYVVSASNANGTGLNSPEANATVSPIVWRAGANSNWDIGVATNWLAGGLPTTYQDGGAAQFDDTALSTTVNLAANVSPVSVTFSNQTQNYTLNSSGGYGIGGPTSLSLLGSGSVTLNTSNTFVGGIAIYGAGTLTIGGAGNLGGGTYAGNVADNSSLTYNSSSAQTLSGVISGSGNLSRGGTNTLTLSGANTYSGTTTLNGGTTVFSGNNTLGGNVLIGAGRLNITANTTASGSLTGGGFNNIGNTANTTAIVGISSGATLTWNTQYGGDFADGGANSLQSAALYNAGTFNITSSQGNAAGTYLPNSGNSYGYLYNTGTIGITGRLWMGNSGGQPGSVAVLDAPSGTVTVSGTGQSNPLYVNHNGVVASSGINLTGGTLAISANGVQELINNTAGDYASINITGTGRLTLVGSSGFCLNDVNSASSTNVITVAGGGELDMSYSYNNNSAAVNTFFNFNGGTVKATATDGNGLFINNTAIYICSGGATIDANGFNPKVGVPLLAPSGNGVTSIALGGTTNGYIGAPLVKITGGGGKGAAAVANFDPSSGKITGITVTSPGSDYTSAPTVTLAGGNGGSTGAGVGTATATASLGAVSSGGLTKAGAGTLFLTANNTYTGGTLISGGTLALTNSGSIAGSSAITVGSGANLDVSAVSFTLGANQTLNGNGSVTGGAIINGTLAPGSSAIGTLTFGTAPVLNGITLMKINRTNTPTADQVVVTSGTLNYGGTLTVTNIGGTAFVAGDAFKMFPAGSYGGKFAATNLPPLNSGLGWSNTLSANGKLAVVSVVSTTPTNISWSVSGTNLTLSWPADHTGWRLLVQTNNLTNGISSNTNDWGMVSSSLQTNQLSFPMNQWDEFFRLVYP
jgi:autotransporter-associated beta strand protein